MSSSQTRSSRFQSLLRWLVTFAIVWGLYVELFKRNDIAQLKVLFWQNLSSSSFYFLLLCVLLMPLNWLMETCKWRVFTQPWSGMKFGQSLRAVLAGVAASMLLPNRTGDYLGRWLLAPDDQKASLLLASLAGHYCQFLVLLGLGLPSVLALSAYIKDFPLTDTRSFLYLVAGLLLLLLLLGLVLIPRLLRRYAAKIQEGEWPGFWRHVQSILQHGLEVLTQYRMSHMLQGLAWAVLRYGLYSVQYYLILRFYGIQLPLGAAMTGVGSIYLFQTAIPLPPVLGLLARGEIALLVWGIWGANALSILAASYTLFVLNLVFPALLGLFYIVKK